MEVITKDNLSTYDKLIKKYIKDKAENLIDLFAYGVLWRNGVKDSKLARIGNLYFHKTLPIQSQLAGCIAQGGKVIYWLNHDDWRFRRDTAGFVLLNLTLTVTGSTYTLTNDIFSTLLYDLQYVKINKIVCQVESINTTSKTATLNPVQPIEAGTYDVELGAVLNGYDGTVRVYCPTFYIRSFLDNTYSKVYISTMKIDDTWTELKACLIDAYKATILNTVPENMGYLSTLPVNSTISVVNTNAYCRGGSNNGTYDKYLASDRYRTLLGKPSAYRDLSTFREYTKLTNSHILSYNEYKNIFYWLYVIEYANFNNTLPFMSSLTSEGYKQGGLGTPLYYISYKGYYLNEGPLTPCGYGDLLGNNSGVNELVIPLFTFNIHILNPNHYQKTNNITYSTDSNSITITSVKLDNICAIYAYSNYAFGEIAYSVQGLTDGLLITFLQGNTIASSKTLGSISEDGTCKLDLGEFKINTLLYIMCSKALSTCSITISLLARSTSSTGTCPALQVNIPRWHGFDNVSGDMEIFLDGIVLYANDTKALNVYASSDYNSFADNLNDSYKLIIFNLEITLGHIDNLDVQESAEIFPSLTASSRGTMQGFFYNRIGSNYGNVLVGSNLDGDFSKTYLTTIITTSSNTYRSAYVGVRTVSYLN